MFLGQYQHTLDDKGRVVMPSKFREDLAPGCVITKGQEHCLYVFPLSAWAEEMERVRRLPRTDRRARNFARAFFAAASDQELDGQGRIVVPGPLREYAGLEKDATVVGVAERIEVWSTDRWERMSAEADDYYAEIEETLYEDQGI